MNQRFVMGMFVKGMSSIPLTIIPLTCRFMESPQFKNLKRIAAMNQVASAGLRSGPLEFMLEFTL